MLKALIFDFDGLILDTETPELQVWQKIYRDHGVELSTSLWGQIVGGNGISVFDPIGHLERLGLFDQFDSIMCGDDVLKTKPFPDLFIGTLEKLAVQSSEAIVFEDSPNGIQAANAAGIFSVAVPNPVTRMFDLSHARLIFDSLEQVSLD